MQVGDLVELSAQGRKLLWLKALHNRFGIVVSGPHRMRWKVQWFGNRGNKRSLADTMAYSHSIDRKSIKHIKSS